MLFVEVVDKKECYLELRVYSASKSSDEVRLFASDAATRVLVKA